MDLPQTGGCQCGAVRYELSAEPLTLYVCHCRECQRQSAAAFGMSLRVPADGFRITRGEPKAWHRPADSGNTVACYFCPDCGTRLYHGAPHRPETVNVRPGSLDDTGWLAPVGHVWARRAQPWVAVPEGPTTYAGQPDDFTPLIEAWRRQSGS